MPRLEHAEAQQLLRDRGTVQHLFEALSQALTDGDAATIAGLWEVPAYVIGDDGVMLMTSSDQIERFYAAAAAEYAEHGIVATVPDLRRVDWVTNRMCIVDVRWPWIDADGNEVGEESSIYALRRAEDGELRIRVALLKSAASFH